MKLQTASETVRRCETVGPANGDNSIISVVCKTTARQIAGIAGEVSAIEEHDLARIVGVVARMYQNHLCIPGRKNHGHALIAFLKSDGAVKCIRASTGE